MNKAFARGLIIGSAVGVVAAAISIPIASSATDPAPAAAAPAPTLTVPLAQSFVLGSQISASEGPGGDQYTSSIPMRLRWTSTGAPDRFFDIAAFHTGPCDPASFETRIDGDTQTPRSDVTVTDYHGTASCPEKDGFTVIATNPDGNLIGKQVLKQFPTVYQEDGQIPAGATAPTLTVNYSGQWPLAFCDCASGAAQRRTTQTGDAAAITRTFARGEHVALVMAEGPGRGKAAIFVDGTHVETVDTFAAVNTNRIVEWDMAMSKGTHTIRVVNQGTAGRPRIDLDAILTTS